MTERVPGLPRILQLKPSLQVGRKAAINHSPNQPRWAVAAQGRSKLGGLDQPTKWNHGSRKIQDVKLYFFKSVLFAHALQMLGLFVIVLDTNLLVFLAI